MPLLPNQPGKLGDHSHTGIAIRDPAREQLSVSRRSFDGAAPTEHLVPPSATSAPFLGGHAAADRHLIDT
jgi:hypothetical protein